MEKTPEISVIMPVFNVEKYVEASIQSALAQTFKDFELIVIDDCSTDRSAEIVENMISSTQGGERKTLSPSSDSYAMSAIGDRASFEIPA